MDLLIQIFQISVPFFLLLHHSFPVTEQQCHPLLHGAVAFIPKVGIMPDIPQQHSGILQALDEPGPLDVVLTVVPPSGGISVNADQALFLIVTEGGWADACGFGKFADKHVETSFLKIGIIKVLWTEYAL